MIPGRIAPALTALTGFMARASNQIATLAVTLVAARYLAPAEFGIFALGSMAITLIRTLLYGGAFEYLLKAPDARSCASESLAVNVAVVAGLSGLLACAAIVGERLFASGAIAAIVLALLPSNLISALAAWRESLLLRSRRIRLYYGLTTLAELIAMAVAIGLLAAGFKVQALVWQVYVRGTALLIFYSLVERAIWSDRFAWRRFVTILRWSLHRYGSTLVSFGANYGADLFLGIFLSPAATGLYRASSRIVTAVSDLFAQPTRMIAMTFLSARSAAGERSDTIWPAIFTVAAAVGWSALAGLAAVAVLLVPIALGEQWRAAGALVPILCLARGCALFDAVAATALVAYDHPRPLFYVQTATAATTLLLVVVTAPFGLMPATCAVAAGAVAASTMIAILAIRRLPGSGTALRNASPALAAPVCGTLAGALAGRLVAAEAGLGPIPMTVAAIVAGLAGWLLALLVVRRRARALLAALRSDPAPAALSRSIVAAAR